VVTGGDMRAQVSTNIFMQRSFYIRNSVKKLFFCIMNQDLFFKIDFLWSIVFICHHNNPTNLLSPLPMYWTMTRINVRNQKHRAGIAAISAAIVAVLAMSSSPAAFANLPGNPTMWTDAVNAGQTNTYNYNVAAGVANLYVGLMVDNANSKPVMALSVTAPNGVVTPCPVIGGTTLTIAECNIGAPLAGAWTITVAAGALPAGAQPTEYAVAAHAQ